MNTVGASASRPLDIAIVGAGPCGLAVAVAAHRARLAAVTFDRGCLVSSIASYPMYMTFFSTAEKIAIGDVPFALAAEKPTRRDALAYYRMVVRHFGLAVRQYEHVDRISRSGSGFVLGTRTADGRTHELHASTVVIATGYFGTPNALGVPGEGLPHVTHLYREGHEAFDRDAVVVGGGNSAVEAALDLWRAGARVTIVHVGPSFDRNIKPWVLPDALNRLKDGSIAARWSARVARIEPGRVVIERDGVSEIIPACHVYLMTGFRPSSELLRQLEVPVDEETGIPAHDRATMETPVPGVFIAGVLASGYDANKIFIENGRQHGELIVRQLAQRVGAGPATAP